MNVICGPALLGTLLLLAPGRLIASSALEAIPVAPSRVIAAPHLVRLLPAGTVARTLNVVPGRAPVLMKAILLPGAPPAVHAPTNAASLSVSPNVLEPAGACWIALAVLEGRTSGSAGGAKAPGLGTLILARLKGKKAIAVATLRRPARTLMAMQACWTDCGWVLGAQWTLAGTGRTGALDLYALGTGKPVAIVSLVVDAFYFQNGSRNGSVELVVYAPESDSVVILPRVYALRDGHLVAASGGLSTLERRLLGEYEGVLASYRVSAPAGDPPRMVLDVELLKGRLLARHGDTKGAFQAFEELLKFVPGAMDLGVTRRDVRARREILERVAEARRRAASLFGITVQARQ